MPAWLTQTRAATGRRPVARRQARSPAHVVERTLVARALTLRVGPTTAAQATTSIVLLRSAPRRLPRRTAFTRCGAAMADALASACTRDQSARATLRAACAAAQCPTEGPFTLGARTIRDPYPLPRRAACAPVQSHGWGRGPAPTAICWVGLDGCAVGAGSPHAARQTAAQATRRVSGNDCDSGKKKGARSPSGGQRCM